MFEFIKAALLVLVLVLAGPLFGAVVAAEESRPSFGSREIHVDLGWQVAKARAESRLVRGGRSAEAAALFGFREFTLTQEERTRKYTLIRAEL